MGQVFPNYNHNPNSGIEARTAMDTMFYKPDEIKYHGSVNRGATTLNFFGKREIYLHQLVYSNVEKRM